MTKVARIIIPSLVVLSLLVVLLLPVSIVNAQAWLGSWAYRIPVTTDNAVIDDNLAQFPLTIKLGTSVGKTSADVSAVFDELASDQNRFKIAVTESDGTTQLYVEIEYWDDATETAVLHVSSSGWTMSSAGETLLLYYDSAQDDNITYIGDMATRTEVWDSNFELVSHMAAPESPEVTISDQGIVFDAEDIIGATTDRIEDCAVVEGDDGKFYMFIDQYQGAGVNDHIYCVQADDAAFTTNVTQHGKIIDVDNLRVWAAVYDTEDDEYIIYCINWVAGSRYTKAYSCTKANFEAGDGGVGDWVDEGTVLALGAAGKWDDAGAQAFDVHWTGLTWEMWYDGDNGTDTMGMGYATCADPKGSFTKGANDGWLMNLTFNYQRENWHDFYHTNTPRSIYYGLGSHYLMFCEGVHAGSYYRVGSGMLDRSTKSFWTPSANSPQLGDEGAPGYANVDACIVSGGTIYLYYQSTKAGASATEWYNQRVATVSISTSLTTIDDVTYGAYRLHQIVNSPLRRAMFAKKDDNDPPLASGIVGYGQDFDGTEDYTTMADAALDLDFALADDFTLELLCKGTKVTNGSIQRLIAKTEEPLAAPAWNIRLNGDGSKATTFFAINDGAFAPSVTGTDNMADGNPHHIVAMRDVADDEIRLYEDGVEVDSDTDTTTGTLANAGALYIGCITGPTTYYDGIIDEVRISRTDRSDAWIKATYYSLYDDLLTFGSSASATPPRGLGFGIVFFTFGIL